MSKESKIAKFQYFIDAYFENK